MQNQNKDGLCLLESRRRWWKLFTCKLHRGWNSFWLSFTLASNFYGVTALATSHLSLWNEVIWLHLDSDQLILSCNHLVCIVFLRETLAKYRCHVGKTQILDSVYLVSQIHLLYSWGYATEVTLCSKRSCTFRPSETGRRTFWDEAPVGEMKAPRWTQSSKWRIEEVCTESGYKRKWQKIRKGTRERVSGGERWRGLFCLSLTPSRPLSRWW